jgi:hypothetical protein
MVWVGNSVVDAVGVDVFEGADLVADGLVAASSAMADRAIDAPKSDSKRLLDAVIGGKEERFGDYC